MDLCCQQFADGAMREDRDKPVHPKGSRDCGRSIAERPDFLVKNASIVVKTKRVRRSLSASESLLLATEERHRSSATGAR